MAMLTLELRPHKTRAAFNLRRWAELLADRELAKVEGRIETDASRPHHSESYSCSKSWKLSVGDWASAAEPHGRGPRADRMPDLDRRWGEGGRRGLGVARAHEAVGRASMF